MDWFWRWLWQKMLRANMRHWEIQNPEKAARIAEWRTLHPREGK